MFWKKKKKETDPISHPDDESLKDSREVKVIIKTDLGNVRTNNEDAAGSFHLIEDGTGRNRGYLLIVADGMGGHQAGEVASKMAVDIISQEYFRDAGEPKREKSLLKAFKQANKLIFEKSGSEKKFNGMGTTCTVVVVTGRILYVAHAGDSRAYLLKKDNLILLTEDHTYVQDLVNNGNITREEADNHPQRNILTNAMGTKPDLRVDAERSKWLFEEGDKLLLCSDGLYDYFTDDELKQVLQNQSLLVAADFFIAEAKRRGGRDNITVLLADKSSVTAETDDKQTQEIIIPKITRDSALPSDI